MKSRCAINARKISPLTGDSPMPKFRDLAIGQAFDWIGSAGNNSFFEQCRKISTRKYVGLQNGRAYTVGTINAEVFNVEPGAIAEPEPVTPVLFRIDRSGTNKQVTAVFPAEPADYEGRFYSCYAHIGQHGSASREWWQSKTRPATPAEYAELKAELESAPYGYRLQVCRRMTAAHRAAFNATVKARLS
ncbi:hypothetical protein NKJ28_00260 [Mesorhizobium sp. M0145]|uniref:hypothetical protein n=1 Tax=Mesorhizobium sp. M0145 TaxID=2956895 RepID=UPI00333894E8